MVGIGGRGFVLCVHAGGVHAVHGVVGCGGRVLARIVQREILSGEVTGAISITKGG